MEIGSCVKCAETFSACGCGSKAAERYEAYEDPITDRQEYKIDELGGKSDGDMTRSEASDYIKKLQGRESGTWRAESGPLPADPRVSPLNTGLYSPSDTPEMAAEGNSYTNYQPLPEWPPAARHIITGLSKWERDESDKYRCGPVYLIDGEWSWCNGGSGDLGHIDGGGGNGPLCSYCGMNMETGSFSAESFGAEDMDGRVVNVVGGGDKVYVTIRFPDTNEHYGYDKIFIGEMEDVMLAESFGAESKFDKLAKEIAEEYEEKGKSPKEAMEIGEATAAKIGRAKFGKRKFAKMGQKAESFGADEELEYPCDVCGKPSDYNFQDGTLRWKIKDDEFVVGKPKISVNGDQNDFYCKEHADLNETGIFYAEDDIDFDKSKADRNKDGRISDWERAVGNKVAKGIRESKRAEVGPHVPTRIAATTTPRGVVKTYTSIPAGDGHVVGQFTPDMDYAPSGMYGAESLTSSIEKGFGAVLGIMSGLIVGGFAMGAVSSLSKDDENRE